MPGLGIEVGGFGGVLGVEIRRWRDERFEG